MRFSLRLLRAPNQNIKSPKLWQDPVLGYWETHGKMEFLPGEQYNLTDDEKKAVLWRYRVKEILKREYMRREFDPNNFKYKVSILDTISLNVLLLGRCYYGSGCLPLVLSRYDSSRILPLYSTHHFPLCWHVSTVLLCIHSYSRHTHGMF
jgi:hypothetical protein